MLLYLVLMISTIVHLLSNKDLFYRFRKRKKKGNIIKSNFLSNENFPICGVQIQSPTNMISKLRCTILLFFYLMANTVKSVISKPPLLDVDVFLKAVTLFNWLGEFFIYLDLKCKVNLGYNLVTIPLHIFRDSVTS